MKKVLAVMAGFIFAAFGVGIIGLLISLTYQALQKLFPSSFENQMWGLIVFDIAALCWAAGFVFKSKSVAQYGAAGFGFIVALLGTLGMVAAEVLLGGQQLIPAEEQQIGQWMVYGFIAVTIIHVIMLYVHHGAAPEIWEQIDLGIARSQVTDTARKQATKRIEQEQALLAESIADELVNQIKRDLNLPIPATGTIFQPKEQTTPTISIPHPIEEPQGAVDWQKVSEPVKTNLSYYPLNQQAFPQDEPTSAQVPFLDEPNSTPSAGEQIQPNRTPAES